MSLACNPEQIIQPGRSKLQAFRCNVGIPIHHSLRFPTSQSLQFPRGGTCLAVPCCKRVPQIVPTEILYPCPFKS